MAKLRYYVPSALTSAGIAFAALSVQASVDGSYRTSAWWAMMCVLTDKLDGAAARALKASSAFGAQLDSFADFFSFGIAPATLFYAFFSTWASAGWTDGIHRTLVAAIAFFYLICVAARLARFNITTSVHGDGRFFFGIPTTFVGGILMAAFAVLLKYGDPAWTASDPSSDHLYVFGHVRMDALMRWFPWLLVPGGIAMISTFRMPKLGRTRWKSLDLLQAIGVVTGYVAGITRHLPEYLVTGATLYLLASVAFHFTSMSKSADVRLPPLFEDVQQREREAAGGLPAEASGG